ncbi:fungal-specific transcription factor domain-containing protein [Aspergillus oleicola]
MQCYHIKKIKCDGVLPACRNCTKVGIPCEASVVLQRNTRVRGFVPDQVQDLKAQLAYCQQALQLERDSVVSLRQQLAHQLPPAPPAVYPSHDPHSGHGHPSLLSSLNRYGMGAVPDSSDYVIKHMGRMVLDPVVVEEACKRVLHLTEAFPEGCYSLYLGQPTSDFESSTTSSLGGPSAHDRNEEILANLNQPIAFYTEQIEQLFRHWEAFCRVLAGEQLMGGVQVLLKKVQDGSPIATSDERWFKPEHLNQLIARADIGSLQALTLFAFYHQLSGRSLSLIQLNGHMVRIAQSLGLHRHARRFRLKAAEIELRKRLWWWIYIFDRITSIVHGLPTLISDTDVDNDMPTDCQFRCFEDTELIHLLPGQTTPVFFFNHYVAIGKKLSHVLDVLYTTTQRRQGAAKIERLDWDMRVWSQNFDADENIPDSIQVHVGSPDSGCGKIIFWLRVLTHLSMVLIHRPGLTFDESTPEFATCLTACATSSSVIIHLLDVSELGTACFRSLLPIGPGTIFHCALTLAFSQSAAIPAVHESVDAISKAIDILEKYHQQASSGNFGEIETSFYIDSINATIKTLRNLALLLQHPSSHLSGDTESWPSDTALGGVPYSPFGINSLYDLNHMTAMVWVQDITDPFGHLPDLGW